MNEARQRDIEGLSSTQTGAVAEAVVASGLMLASNGRLSPYKPVADDDGTDLLVVDKKTRNIIPVQVKSRTKVDNPRAETVQFDVRLKTFARNGKGYLLAVLLDGARLRAAWLIPSKDLEQVALATPEKLSIVASVKRDTKDRCRKFRHDDFDSIARIIMSDEAVPVQAA